MRKKLSILTLILVCSLIGPALPLPTLKAMPRSLKTEPVFPDQRVSAKRAAYWLVSSFQNDDGGYASFGPGANQAPSTVPGTLDAILALAAAGYNPSALFPGKENAPIGYLTANEDELISFAEDNGGSAGKVVLALSASAVDPRSFNGHDYVADLADHLEPSGSYSSGDPFKQSIAMLGVASAGEPVPNASVLWLEGLQAPSGAWGDGFGTVDNADSTAIAIMAILAAGKTPARASISDAVDFLANAQQSNGGWSYGPGLAPSANSTALVIQALAALGENWYSASGPWVKGGQSPLDALLSYQSASGAFQSDFGQGPFDDFYATVQSLPAVTGRAFPLPARLVAAERALSCLDDMQHATSGGWPAFAGGAVDAGGTSRAIQAIAALNENPQSARWTTAGGTDAAEALEALTPGYLSSGRGGRVGIVMQGLVASGPPYTVTDFAGEDLTLLMAGHLAPNGEYDSTAFGIFAHAEAMLGLLRAGEPVAQSAIDFLASADVAGSWGDPDSNGIALQVLGELGRGAPTTTLAVLKSTQTADGGWGFGGVAGPNATSEVVQGLTAAGQNPFGPDWSQVVDGQFMTPADVIMAGQADNGCWPNQFGPGDDPYATTDAILLLASQPGWGFSLSHLPFTSAGQ